MNIEFEYLYRDSGNFKSYGSVVFGNPNNVTIEEIDQSIIELLGDDRTFNASRLAVPEMFFTEFPYNPDLDWGLHEYSGVSASHLPVNDAQRRDISDLLSQMRLERNECVASKNQF